MAPKDFDIFGIQELYRPPQEPADVDIVAVHGLTGGATKTWTFEPGNVCWLNHPDFLPKYIKNARVLSWGYNANISTFGGKKTSSDRILGHAQTLVSQLQADRELEDANSRPIIFLCHSLGGIIVKQALIYAASRNAPKLEHLHTIYTCTYSIMFFGTPHNGTGKAHLLGTLQKLASLTLPKGMIRFENNLVNALGKNSETLQSILDQFSPLMPNFQIFFFWEQEKTDLKYGRDYIVNEASAAPIIDNTERSAIAADHRGMCRFKSNTSPGFRTTMAALRRYCQEAPQKVKARNAMATTRLNQNRWYQAVDAMNAIETVTGSAETWKAARMYRIRQLRAMETTNAIDTNTGSLQVWKSARLNENRQLQETTTGNNQTWKTAGLNQSRWIQETVTEDLETWKTPRPDQNNLLEKTIAGDPETQRTERMDQNQKLQPMETMDPISTMAGNPETREAAGKSENRKLQGMEINDALAITSLPPPQAEELSYFPKHEPRNQVLGFQTRHTDMRHSTEPSWTVRMIVLCFFSGMISAVLTYFLLESLQHYQNSGPVFLRDDYVDGETSTPYGRHTRLCSLNCG